MDELHFSSKNTVTSPLAANCSFISPNVVIILTKLSFMLLCKRCVNQLQYTVYKGSEKEATHAHCVPLLDKPMKAH